MHIVLHLFELLVISGLVGFCFFAVKKSNKRIKQLMGLVILARELGERDVKAAVDKGVEEVKKANHELQNHFDVAIERLAKQELASKNRQESLDKQIASATNLPQEIAKALALTSRIFERFLGKHKVEPGATASDQPSQPDPPKEQ